MSRRKRLSIAVICGLISSVLLIIYLSNVEAGARLEREAALERFGGEKTVAYVASRTLGKGELITADCLEEREWLVDLLPEGAISRMEDVIDKRAASSVVKNEVLTDVRLEDDEQLLVPEGLCAVSVSSQDVNAVGGALYPGSRVHVYVQSGKDSALLGENILVLETSMEPAAGSDEKERGSAASGSVTWVTLAVTPESVQELIAASNAATLYFVLPASVDPLVDIEAAVGEGESDE